MRRDDPAYAGQRHYTPWFLKIYDPLVLGFVAEAVWRFPTGHLVEHYNRHVRRKHLDIGPGTGYFLDHARLPVGASLTLVDPNPNVLAHASRRLAHLQVSVVEADVLKPLAGVVDNRPFDSAALSLVLHCLPGPLPRKATAIAHVAAVLAPAGVLFGATVLGTAGSHTPVSRTMLRAYNRIGAFDNLADSEDGLCAILGESFDAVEIDVVGSVAVFAATRPRQPAS